MIVPRFAILSVLLSKILQPQSSLVLSHKPSLALVVAVAADALVAVVVAVVLVVAVLAQAVVVAVMAPVLALKHALAVKLILVLRTHVQVMAIALLTRVQVAQVIHVLLVLALLKRSLVDNVRTLAVANHASPASPPF